MLRELGVVGKFVEFYGAGLDVLPLADRATIANMAPEYGATCGFFPIDGETLRYLRNTGRDEDRIALVEAYAKENGFWRDENYAPVYTDTLHLDMGTIVPAISGPKRPQDYVALTAAKSAFADEMEKTFKRPMGKEVAVAGEDYTMESGKVVIASITSCTNTSNPYVMIGAGLVARKAAALGLDRKPWVKTSLAPGSQVVSEYLEAAGLQEDLDKIGFNLVGYCRMPSQRAIWSRHLFCPVTATLRAGSHQTCVRTTSRRHRWSSLMLWLVRWISTSPKMLLAKTRTATTCS